MTLDIECTLCNQATAMIGTKLCYRCWELERRIRANPELARKILAKLEKARKDND